MTTSSRLALLSKRQVNLTEALDDPLLDVNLRKRMMADLDRTNSVLGVYRVAVRSFRRFVRSLGLPPGERLRILEVGGGSGGLATQLYKSLSSEYTIEYHLMDLDPEIMNWASQRVQAACGLQVTTHPAGETFLRQFPKESFDIVFSLQVLHHIHPLSALSDFFEDCGTVARRGIWMADFERKRSNFFTFSTANFLAGTPADLAEDGFRSLIRAYSLDEVQTAYRSLSPDFEMQHRRFWWNPFFILQGRKLQNSR